MDETGIEYAPRQGVDARFEKTYIEVKLGVDATRTLRGGLFRLGEIVATEDGAEGVLLLADSVMTEQRVRAEWDRAKLVIRAELLERLSICVLDESGAVMGVPRTPGERLREVLKEVAAHESGAMIERGGRTDFGFVVRKLLLHQFFAGGDAMTVGELAVKAGCSFPTAASVVKTLGSLIERTSDRRVRLTHVPREMFEQLAAGAERARMTVRFADVSGQARTPEALVRRLEKLRPGGIAIGGSLGARHYFEGLDLVGTVRLDLSVHAPRGRMNLEFVKQLDPALVIERDAQRPAAVVVHAVRHSEAMFNRREEGLMWADEVECLLDLKEGALGAQALQFFEWLERRGARR